MKPAFRPSQHERGLPLAARLENRMALTNYHRSPARLSGPPASESGGVVSGRAGVSTGGNLRCSRPIKTLQKKSLLSSTAPFSHCYRADLPIDPNKTDEEEEGVAGVAGHSGQQVILPG